LLALMIVWSSLYF